MERKQIHPNGWDPVSRIQLVVERFDVPVGLPPSVRAGFGGAVHTPWAITGRGARTMCGRTLLVASSSDEPVTCRLCIKRTAV